ncbi:MAG: Ig-like domain-containing protein [Gemmatimonadales bacterium]|nr:Ig-like domain-containing protein [Gemmatimonadales bacterium]
MVLTSAGRVADSLLSSDSTGQAKVRWTLGPTTGSQRLTVSLAGADTTLTVTARARAGAPDTLMFVAPPATGTAGRALPKPVVVQVADAQGNPVPGRTVVFTATGGGSSPARAVTDSTGRARVRWTLGRKAGAMSLVGKVAGSDVKGTLTVAAKVRARPAP